MERENSLICLQGTKDIVRVLGSRVVEGFDPVIERVLNYGGFRIMEGFGLWRVLNYDCKRASNYGGFELWRLRIMEGLNYGGFRIMEGFQL